MKNFKIILNNCVLIIKICYYYLSNFNYCIELLSCQFNGFNYFLDTDVYPNRSLMLVLNTNKINYLDINYFSFILSVHLLY